jgi:hypothetical protein
MKVIDKGDSRDKIDSLHVCLFVYVIWRMSVASTFVTSKCQIGAVKCDWTFQQGTKMLRDLDSWKHMTMEVNYK